LIQSSRVCLLPDVLIIKEFCEVVDVANDVGKAMCEFLRIHAGIDNSHIPMWEGFGSAHTFNFLSNLL
jgi:hypothetical protein